MKLRCSLKQKRGTRFVMSACIALIAGYVIVIGTACHGRARRDAGLTPDSQAITTTAADCGQRMSHAAAVIAANAARTDSAEPAPRPPIPAQQPIMRVALFIDQTGSMEQARVPHVSEDAVTPLLDRLQATGGELAVGLIRDRSDAPLARVFVPVPPSPPVFQPHKAGNIFEKAKEQRREDEERARYAARQQAWHADAAARINAFAESIAPLFENADAPATDIHAALLRGDVFVSEPNAFGQSVANIVILVTDGVETVDPETPSQFKAPAELLLVNGTGSEGQLEALHPVRFEALDAAIRYVLEGGSHVRR